MKALSEMMFFLVGVVLALLLLVIGLNAGFLMSKGVERTEQMGNQYIEQSRLLRPEDACSFWKDTPCIGSSIEVLINSFQMFKDKGIDSYDYCMQPLEEAWFICQTEKGCTCPNQISRYEYVIQDCTNICNYIFSESAKCKVSVPNHYETCIMEKIEYFNYAQVW